MQIVVRLVATVRGDDVAEVVRFDPHNRTEADMQRVFDEVTMTFERIAFGVTGNTITFRAPLVVLSKNTVRKFTAAVDQAIAI